MCLVKKSGRKIFLSSLSGEKLHFEPTKAPILRGLGSKSTVHLFSTEVKVFFVVQMCCSQ